MVMISKENFDGGLDFSIFGLYPSSLPSLPYQMPSCDSLSLEHDSHFLLLCIFTISEFSEVSEFSNFSFDPIEL